MCLLPWYQANQLHALPDILSTHEREQRSKIKKDKEEDGRRQDGKKDARSECCCTAVLAGVVVV
jgi:hypothetical protein